MIYYAFSLYADFAGYSLIAIGSAKLLGLEVRPNFQQPFLSTSVPEYWRKWHMSLSFWVRDYIFQPLHIHLRNYRRWGPATALLLAFITIGVWHGAKWGYFWFGVMHGSLRHRLDAHPRAPGRVLEIDPHASASSPISADDHPTFCLVLIPFVVFRADSMGRCAPKRAGDIRGAKAALLVSIHDVSR